MGNSVKIEKVERDSDLYLKYATQTEVQPVYVALDLRTGELSCQINYEINSRPMLVHNGVIQWFGPIPPLKKDAANKLLESFVSLAQNMLNNLDDLDYNCPKWINEELYQDSYFSGQQKTKEIDQDDVYFRLDICEFYCVSTLEELGVTLQMTEDELRERAKALYEESEYSEYPLDGDEEDLFEYLSNRVKEEIDDFENSFCAVSLNSVEMIAGKLGVQWQDGNKNYVKEELEKLPTKKAFAVISFMASENKIAIELYNYFSSIY